MIAGAVYLLCAFTSLLCTVLLVRGFRRTRLRLLMWSAVCFTGLAVNNIVLVIDLMIVPTVDLSTWRLIPAALGLASLVFGLVWESE